jgi:hypothetical protein
VFKYTVVWEQLKKAKTAKLLAAPELHARIHKAVAKERRRDLSFCFLMANNDITVKTIPTSNGDELTLELRFYKDSVRVYNLEDLV